MEIQPITAKEFQQFRAFIYAYAGISLTDAKLPLVGSRLAKRLKHHQLSNYAAYYQMIQNEAYASEKQIAVNLLTTNETHFFREPKHFEFFKNTILPQRELGRSFRIWSAASSSGEEPYTLAMLMHEAMPNESWDLIGSDISTAMLEKACLGSYPIERASEIPQKYLSKYCLKGVGEAAGTLIIRKELRKKVQFMPINLTQTFPKLGQFDVIFLRNVMIYFDVETKRKIVQQLVPFLRDDGYFFISHSESLNGISDELVAVNSAIYRKK